MQSSIRACLVATAIALAGCASPPDQPPSQYATAVQLAVDEGRTQDADAMIARIKKHDHYREAVYPMLYESAHDAYEAGDYEAAARRLSFLVNHYENGSAAVEALVYSLFLARAERGDADPEQVRQLESALAELDNRSKTPFPLIPLIRAQVEFDSGDVALASSSLARFRSTWNGEPAELVPYVQDLERNIELAGNNQP